MDAKTKKMISEMKSGKKIHPSKKKHAKNIKNIATNLESIIKGCEESK